MSSVRVMYEVSSVSVTKFVTAILLLRRKEAMQKETTNGGPECSNIRSTVICGGCVGMGCAARPSF